MDLVLDPTTKKAVIELQLNGNGIEVPCVQVRGETGEVYWTPVGEVIGELVGEVDQANGEGEGQLVMPEPEPIQSPEEEVRPAPGPAPIDLDFPLISEERRLLIQERKLAVAESRERRACLELERGEEQGGWVEEGERNQKPEEEAGEPIPFWLTGMGGYFGCFLCWIIPSLTFQSMAGIVFSATGNQIAAGVLSTIAVITWWGSTIWFFRYRARERRKRVIRARCEQAIREEENQEEEEGE